jgi:DNA-binding response OmpR family regulator
MKKLLIVDDDEAFRGLYRRRLSGSYEVVETGDPEQALALALEYKPDAILLDLRMPKFDGFELCRNFRSLSYTSSLPIFVITGQSGNFKKECETLGVSGYFEKPIDFEKLKATLAASLRNTVAKPPQVASLKMRVPLRLEGTDAEGQQFTELAETESVSGDGFQCVLVRQLTEGSTFEVFLAGRDERHVGRARLVERTAADLQHQRYRFNFETETKDWIVQNQDRA